MKITILILCMALLLFPIVSSAVENPSANFSIQGIPTEIYVGDEFEIIIYGENIQNVLGYQLSYYYDNEYLEVVSLKNGNALDNLTQLIHINLHEKDVPNNLSEDSFFLFSRVSGWFEALYNESGTFAIIKVKALKIGNTKLFSSSNITYIHPSPSDNRTMYWQSFLIGKYQSKENINLPEINLTILEEVVEEEVVVSRSGGTSRSSSRKKKEVIQEIPEIEINYTEYKEPKQKEVINLNIPEEKSAWDSFKDFLKSFWDIIIFWD